MAALFNEKSPLGWNKSSSRYTLPSVSLEPTNIRFASPSTEELDGDADGIPAPVVVPPPRSGNNLNTLQGVFVPTILNIFGVVTFLRMGWMTGECGLLITLAIIFVGELTVTLTALSISAIATNGTMRGGGAYYLISRSLGPEFGGAIGAIFYTANVFGSATFLKGFVEATNDLNILPIGYWWGFLYASIVLVLLTITAAVGARFFIRVLAFIFVLEMGSLLFALISFAFQSAGVTEGYTGWSWSTFTGNLKPHFTQNNTVQSVFAVFFPAIAGIMGGCNMSGDLAKPSYSIPRGTLIAIATATTLYLALIVTMAFTTTYSTLQDYNVFQRVSFVSVIITIGVYSAALSSTLGSMGGGSRILQALARDNLLWFLKPFGAGFGTGDEPVVAILLTYVLVQSALFLPELNTVATISSLFFLFSYGIVNTACFALCISSAPSFRPTFRFYSTYTAFGGVFLCVCTCFLINFYIATGTIAILGALVLYIHTTARETNWGDVSQAILFHQVRKFLLRLDVRKEHIKHWRPSLLLFAKNPTDIRSIVLGNHIKKGGLYLIGHVLLGSVEQQGTQSQEARSSWLRLINLLKVKGFPQLVLTPTFRLGLQNLLLSGGLGVMRPNTVMLAFHTRAMAEVSVNESPDSSMASFQATDRRASASPLSSRLVRQPPKSTIDAIKRIFSHHISPPKLSDAEYINSIKDILFFKCHAILCRNEELLDFDSIKEFKVGTGSRISRMIQYYRSPNRMNIDVWAIPLNSREKFRSPVLSFTLLMAWILQRSDEWQNYTRVRILSVAPDPLQIGGVMEKVKKLSTFCRISADIQVVSLNMTEAHEPFGWDIPVVERFRMFNSTIINHSQDTAITFLPLLHPPQEQEGYDEYLQALDALTVGLPPVLLCRASSPVITTDL